MITFLGPAALALFLVVLAMAAAAVALQRWRRRARAEFLGPQAARWPGGVARLQLALLFGAAVLIVLAAARPSWGSRELSREREGVDLVIVLDVSISMTAADVSPTRLGLAEDALTNLIQAERGSRFGLVFFAGTAFTRSPLSTDTGAVSELIRRAGREGGLTRAGSDLGAALTQAATILEGSDTPGRAVLVVSDGEDHAGTYSTAITALRDKSIVVFTAGVGTAQGGALNDVDPRTGQQRPKVDAQGRPVISRLDEGSLQSIADAGGGRYLHLTSEDGLYELQGDFNALEQTPIGAEVGRIGIERFQWFAGAAFVLLALAWLLPIRRPRLLPARLRAWRPRTGLAMLVVAFIAGACSGGSDSLRIANQDANDLFAAQEFERALEAYQALLVERPDVPELAYNAGNTLHRLGNYERAIAETQRALPPVTTRVGTATYYALGNHLLAAGQLQPAYEAYKSTLLLDPGDGDSKYNLEVVLQLLQQQQQDEQPQATPPGQPQPGEDGEAPQPQPGQASPEPAQPQPGQAEPSPQQVQRELQEALAGIDDELSFEEAIRILDLLRQQQQQQQRPTTPSGAPSGPDY